MDNHHSNEESTTEWMSGGVGKPVKGAQLHGDPNIHKYEISLFGYDWAGIGCAEFTEQVSYGNKMTNLYTSGINKFYVNNCDMLACFDCFSPEKAAVVRIPKIVNYAGKPMISYEEEGFKGELEYELQANH